MSHQGNASRSNWWLVNNSEGAEFEFTLSDGSQFAGSSCARVPRFHCRWGNQLAKWKLRRRVDSCRAWRKQRLATRLHASIGQRKGAQTIPSISGVIAELSVPVTANGRPGPAQNRKGAEENWVRAGT
jgi:hypothetical protein